MLFRPGYLALIRVDGLHIQAPLRGSTVVNNNERRQQSTRVGEVIADGALLEVTRPDGDKPLRFDIHSATLSSLTAVVPVKLVGAYSNPQAGLDMMGKGKGAAHRPPPPR